MANFPLLGDKTAAVVALFWTNRFPQYYEWCLDLLNRIKGAADITLVVADGNAGELPDYVTRIHCGGITYDRYFREAVRFLEENKVGAFYWLGADDIHSGDGVANTLAPCMDSLDVSYGGFVESFDRDVKFPPRISRQFRYNVTSQTWPDSACYRTSIFTEFPPPMGEPRRFIMASFAAANAAGRPPEGAQAEGGDFYYFQHPRGWNDRTFIGLS